MFAFFLSKIKICLRSRIHPLMATFAADINQIQGNTLGVLFCLKMYCLISFANTACNIFCALESWILLFLKKHMNS